MAADPGINYSHIHMYLFTCIQILYTCIYVIPVSTVAIFASKFVYIYINTHTNICIHVHARISVYILVELIFYYN